MINVRKFLIALFCAGLITGLISCSPLPSINEIFPSSVVSDQTNEKPPENDQISENHSSLSAPGTASEFAGDSVNLDNLAEFEMPLGFDTYQITLDHMYGNSDGVYIRDIGKGEVDMTRGMLLFMTLTEGRTENWEGSLEGYEGRLRDYRNIDGVISNYNDGSCSLFDTNNVYFQGMDVGLASLPAYRLPSDYLLGVAEMVETGVLVNERITNQYALSEENFNSSANSNFKISSLELGEVFLDAETGSLVRLVFKGTGKFSEDGNPGQPKYGRMNYELNYLGFNKPVDIASNPGCGPDFENQYPIVPQVFLIQFHKDSKYLSLGTVISLEEAAVFYRAEFGADGWSLTEQTSFDEEDMSIEFSGPGGARVTVSLMEINSTNDSGEKELIGTLINIILQPGY